MQQLKQLTFEEFLVLWNELRRKEQFLFPFLGHYGEIREKRRIPAYSYEQKDRLNKFCLGNLMKDKPLLLRQYIFQNKKFKELTQNEISDSILRYDYFFNLWMVFFNLSVRLEHERDQTHPIANFTYDFRAIELIKVSSDLTVFVERITNNIFEGLNLKQLKKCLNCGDYYYSKKADERNRFCSPTCRIKHWESNPDNKVNRNKKRRKLNSS